MIPRTTTKKVVFGIAIFSLVCSAISLVIFGYSFVAKGPQDVITASTLATTIFFASCAVVLYFVSKPPRYELRPWDEKELPEDPH
jgi:preprotein translocase subunit SecG